MNTSNPPTPQVHNDPSLTRVVELMAQIAVEENWLEYYNSIDQYAPSTEAKIRDLRAELHRLIGEDGAR